MSAESASEDDSPGKSVLRERNQPAGLSGRRQRLGIRRRETIGVSNPSTENEKRSVKESHLAAFIRAMFQKSTPCRVSFQRTDNDRGDIRTAAKCVQRSAQEAGTETESFEK